MKKFVVLLMTAAMAFTAPVSAFAASSTVSVHKKLFSAEKYQGDAASYSTAVVKLNKKAADGKEYIKVDITYPKINGYTDNIAAFNAANKEYARKLGDEFIKEYTKEAKKYHEANGKFRSAKSEPDYSLKMSYSIKFNQSSLVSILYTTTTTVAGVSETKYHAQNYDLFAGKNVTVDDVSLIPTKGETMKLALQKFNSKIKNNKRIYEQVTLKAADIDFYFENKKIVFFVDPGVIADPARGMITYELLDEAARTYLINKAK